MRIQSVTLTGFGPFAEETTIQFPEAGLSIVLGPNESGKSILMRSISAILFGLPPREAEGLRNGGQCEGVLRISQDAMQLEVVRNFTSMAAAEIWDWSGEERVSVYAGGDEAAYREVLERIIGIVDDSTAVGTTFISEGNMPTRVSPGLRDTLGKSKRTSYNKILQELRTRYARITRIDPVSGEAAEEEGELERIEGSLSRMLEGRQLAQDALSKSMQLEEEAHDLEQQLAEQRAEIEAETRTLSALDTLEELQGEERALQEQVKRVEGNELTVRQLQSDLAATIERVNNEHAPLLPLQGTFLDEVRSLEDARAELARVQKEVETVNGHRRDLQNQVRNLTEEHTSLYGAFDELPLDFPERLALYPLRVKELAEVTEELKQLDEKIAELLGEIDQHYARFRRFDDDYGDDLADLGVQETYWHQQLRDLEGDQKRCRQTADEVAEVENLLNTEFAGFAGVAKDFRSRLRNWHRIWQELQARKGPVTKAQDEIADIHAAMERYKAGADNGAAAWLSAVADRERADAEVARLEGERDALVRWSEECQSIARRFNTEFAHLKDKVKPDFPDKLREHHRLKEEYRLKGSALEEARDSLKQSEEIVAERFSRFADKGPEWGLRLEEHRQTVEHSQATLDRVRRDQEQVAELTRELEALQSVEAEESAAYAKQPDSFPDMVREFARLKQRTQSYETDEAEYAQAFAEFANAPQDLDTRLDQYRSDRASHNATTTRIAEAQETLGRHERRLQAMDIVLAEDYVQFKDQPADMEKALASLIRIQSQRKEAQKEWQASVARHQDLQDEKGKDKGFGALLGWNTDRKKELSTLEARIDTLVAQMAELDKETPALKAQVGDLAERDDLEALSTEYSTFKKLQDERAGVIAQSETAATTLKAFQAEAAELEERLKKHCAELNVHNDEEAEALAKRYRDYKDSLGRRAVSKEDDLRRLEEMAAELGPLAERFSGDSKTWMDVQNALLEGFRIYKKRDTDIEALKARIDGMPDASETTSVRNRTLAAMKVEAEELGLVEGESVEELIGDWQEYEVLYHRMQADKAIIKAAEEDDGGDNNRLRTVAARLEELTTELGALVAHSNYDELIDEINLYFTLQERLGQLATERPDLPPKEDVEADLAMVSRQQRSLEALGVRAGTKADPDVAEEGYRKWKKVCERLESRIGIVSRQLEIQERDGQKTTVLDRIQARLDEQGAGLGNFTEVVDLDETLKRYDEYLALTVRLEGLKKTLEILPPQTELESTYHQVETEMAEARDKLGLAPGEQVKDISALHEKYSDLVRRMRAEDEARNRLLSGVSPGDRAGRPTSEVLGEMTQKLEELRVSLGGFEDAGDESEEVVGQFHASEELKGEIRAVQATVDALRTIQELDDWIETTRQPVLALEKRLEVAGDVNNLRAMRGRFRAFEQLQETIRGLRESLEQNPTLEALAATKDGLQEAIEGVRSRVRALFDEHPRLEGWFNKFIEQPDGLRPGVTDNLAGLHHEANDLEQMIETTWTNLRQHNEATDEIRVNLPLRDQNVRQMQRQLHTVAMQKESMKRAIDLLVQLMDAIPDHLVGSLQLRARDILKGLTDGRYVEMRLEGDQFEPVVTSPEGLVQRGEVVTGGLRDQLYFALRVAMAQELAGTIGLPFLIDDPFLHLDHTRLQHAQAYLKTLGDKYQVILFTHDERYRDCGPIAHDLNFLLAARAAHGNGHGAATPVPTG